MSDGADHNKVSDQTGSLLDQWTASPVSYTHLTLPTNREV